MSECIFCQIVAGKAPATIVQEWPEALALVPLKQVVDGHVLILPKAHVSDFVADPALAGQVAARAGQLAAERYGQCNLITSRGVDATQSVFHLHYHLLPRAHNDGLALPWYSGKSKTKNPH